MQQLHTQQVRSDAIMHNQSSTNEKRISVQTTTPIANITFGNHVNEKSQRNESLTQEHYEYALKIKSCACMDPSIQRILHMQSQT